MDQKQKSLLPAELLATLQRFEQWRKQRRRGEAIPPELWEVATQLARHYGVTKVASTLRLCHQDLKERVLKSSSLAETPVRTPVCFVELPLVPAPVAPPTGGAHLEIVAPGGALTPTGGAHLEIVAPGGAILRLTLPASQVVEPASLVAAFLGRTACSR